MKLSELLKTYEIKETNQTERGELMREFLENINAERGKLPLINFGRLGKLLEGIPTKDLYTFLSMCRDRKQRNGSFSKFFWWAIKSNEK